MPIVAPILGIAALHLVRITFPLCKTVLGIKNAEERSDS
jgi:hypothetical protein